MVKPSTTLLREALRKRDGLYRNPYWKDQIPEGCPPVLWFGDHNKENLIVTVGLNPSHGEFFKTQDDARRLHYLSQRDQRFYVYSEQDLKNPQLAEVTNNVIQSYDRYFQTNPYSRWFGKTGGYNVEGYLNHIDASFYGGKPVNCVHIDLFPFVTVDKYSDLDSTRLETDIFGDERFQKHFIDLLEYLDPKFIIVFGRGTVNQFNRHYNGRISLDQEFKEDDHRYAKYGHSTFSVYGKKIPVIGLSVNLGNPRGFTKERLGKLAKQVHGSPTPSAPKLWTQLPFLLSPVLDEYLEIALQHEINQRLAQIGDAALRMTIREHYYGKESSADDIQTQDSELGNNKYLAKIAFNDLKLNHIIRSKSGLNRNILVTKTYADTLEAIIGAMYKTDGLENVRPFVKKWIIKE
jgi:23S rRNA maturation mini-RNase III